MLATTSTSTPSSASSAPRRWPQLGVAVTLMRSTNANATHPHSRPIHPSNATSTALSTAHTRLSAVDPILRSDDQRHDREVLLVRRAHSPMKGWWGMPGGKVEMGETLKQAAQREVLEECGLHVIVHDQPFYTTELIVPPPSTTSATVDSQQPSSAVGHYVLLHFLAHPIQPHGGMSECAGDDALELRWFNCQDLINMVPASEEDKEEDSNENEDGSSRQSDATPRIIPSVATVVVKAVEYESRHSQS